MNKLNFSFPGLRSFRFPTFNISMSQLEQKYHILLIMITIIIVMYASVGILYNALRIALTGDGAVTKSPGRVTKQIVSKKEPPGYYVVIPERNLFGTLDNVAEKKEQIEETPANKVPDLASVLEVKGTVAGSGKDGFAVIEEKGKNKQQLYQVGNVVAGAKLIKIMRNEVTFQVGTAEKILKMDEKKAPASISSRPTPAAPPVPATPAEREEPMVIRRSEVTASLNDMGTMLSQAQVRPYYSGGAPDGFMITNIKPGSVYEKIGLMNGDIIQGTNDRRLLTADDWMSLYNSMKAGSTLTLKIKRRGQEESLQYVFQ